MTFEVALFERLAGNVVVAGLVERRIYWSTAPQGAPSPRITLDIVTLDTQQNYGGVEKMQRARVRLNSWAQLLADAAAVNTAALNALLPPMTIAGMKFRRCIVDRTIDFVDRTTTETLNRRATDLLLWHSKV